MLATVPIYTHIWDILYLKMGLSQMLLQIYTKSKTIMVVYALRSTINFKLCNNIVVVLKLFDTIVKPIITLYI